MEATLQEILEAREWRANRQKELLDHYQKPLLCFTMNIPGPEKWNRDISVAFTVGNLLLRESLGGILHYESRSDHTGCAAFYVADLPPRQLKRIAMEAESTGPMGRLFDMDVLTPEGEKLSRQKPRSCLLCGEDARVCARSRAHGLEALQAKTRELLQDARQWLAEYIAVTAYFALSREVNTTPKPGLVDRNNCGAHQDMGLRHFFASANALRPYFYRFAETGMETSTLEPAETFAKIRPIGMEAEAAMLRATGGVNTHKGAIFSMGLLCAAAGRLPPHEWSADALLRECAAMTGGIVEEDFGKVTAQNAGTVGEQLYVQYGITGVRGQAEAGFPAVQKVGLPVYRAALQTGLTPNHAGAVTLLHLIANTDDTNLIHRAGRKRQLELQGELQSLLSREPHPTLDTIQDLDKRFIEETLSPGGSADLLAMTYFLENIEKTL